MKVLQALPLLLAVLQAKSVTSWADLKFANKYVEPVSAIVPDVEENLKPSPRIVSGTAVAQGFIPWQALLIMESTGLCGGVLISSEWILTAAHCINGYSSFEIVLGGTSSITTQENTVTESARQAFIHANYNAKTIANDIGVLRLSALVSYTNYIDAIRLPSLSQVSYTFYGAAAVVSGYGRISSTSQATSGVLLQTDVTVIRNDVCIQTFNSFVESSNICTIGVNGKGPCQGGDSGGPLAFAEQDSEYTLIGIMSFTAENCPADTPAVYSRITSYLTWISETTGVALRP